MTTKRVYAFPTIGPDAAFRAGLESGEIRIQRCSQCNRHVFYPRALCPGCGAPDLDWVTASGRGTVYSTSIERERPEKGPDRNIALVDLEEGPRLMTRVVGIAPERVRIGMPVEAFIDGEGGEPLIYFRPAAESDTDGP